jgi:DNA-binding MarR family transcriptional regulator
LKKKTHNRPHSAPFLPFHPALADWTSLLIIKAAERLRSSFSDRLSELELEPKHYGILFLLRNCGSLSQVEIGEWMNIDRAPMVQIVDRLEQQGLVERKQNPQDRRLNAIALTQKGEAVLVRGTEIAKAVEDEFFAKLPASDRQQLHQLLTRLLESDLKKID